MRIRHRAALLALVAASSAAPLCAQAARSAAGTWIAEFDRGVRNENGVVTSIGKARARLALEQRGDSLFGTLTAIDAAENAPPPRTIRGAASMGGVRLEASPVDAIVRTNDDERHVPMRTTYEITVTGDTMTGTLRGSAVDGSITGDPRPFSATREKKAP